MQPSALVVGAKKCGTGAIKNFLKHHPNVYFLEREAHFFGKPLHYDNGEDSFFRVAYFFQVSNRYYC